MASLAAVTIIGGGSCGVPGARPPEPRAFRTVEAAAIHALAAAADVRQSSSGRDATVEVPAQSLPVKEQILAEVPDAALVQLLTSSFVDTPSRLRLYRVYAVNTPDRDSLRVDLGYSCGPRCGLSGFVWVHRTRSGWHVPGAFHAGGRQ